MKLKILSDGGRNTRVIDEETGEPLDGVVSITWTIRAGREAFCLLEMEQIPIEVVGDQIKRYELHTDTTPMSEEPKVGTSNDQETVNVDEAAEEARNALRSLRQVTDAQRDRVRKSVPEMPTHRRET